MKGVIRRHLNMTHPIRNLTAFARGHRKKISPRNHPIFASGPLLFGHRGAPAQAPENTLTGFRLARALGAHGVELDVRMCRSGELVVIHDARLNRTTTGRGFVRSRSLAEIQTCAIRWGANAGAFSERVPTLEDVFRECAGAMLINIEIKGYPRLIDGIEEKIIALVHDFGAIDRVIVSSFNPLPLRRLRKLDANLATGFLIDRNFFIHRTERVISRLAGIDAIHLEAPLASRRFIRRLKMLGLKCVIWGEVPGHKIDPLLRLGIDGLITDRPDRVRQYFERGNS